MHWVTFGVIGGVIGIVAALLVCVFLLMITGLAWQVLRTGKRVRETAQSRTETVESYQLMVATLLKVLRILRGHRTSTVDNGPGDDGYIDLKPQGDTGRTTEAITLHEQILTAQERLLGPSHPDTLASRNTLASAYRDAGRTTEAEKLK